MSKYINFLKAIFGFTLLIFCFDLLLNYPYINKYLTSYQIILTSLVMIFFLFIISSILAFPIRLLSAGLGLINRKFQHYFNAFVLASLFALFSVVFLIVTYFLHFEGLIPRSLYTILALIVILIGFITIITFGERSWKYFIGATSLIKNRFILFLIIPSFLVISFLFVSDQIINENEISKGKNDSISKSNVFLITIDELSQKTLNISEEKKQIPFISDFSKESYVFRKMNSNGNSTIMGMPSIFNSRYPFGEVRNDSESLASLLKASDYKFIFVTSSNFSLRYLGRVGLLDTFDVVIPPYGGAYHYKISYPWVFLDRFCYDKLGLLTWFSYIVEYYYINRLASSSQLFKPLTLTDCSLPDNFASIINNCKRYQNQPLFVWFHIFLIHEENKYLTPKLHSSMFNYIDYEFENFIKNLEEIKAYDNSIVILTSDHGSRLNLPILSQGMIGIPFIIRVPGQKPSRYPLTLAEQVDIAPTILDILNLPIPKWMEGESLVKYFNGGKSNKPNFSMADNVVAIYKDDHKLIYNLEKDEVLLYNLNKDPEEKYDLSKEKSKLVANLKQLIINKLKGGGK